MTSFIKQGPGPVALQPPHSCPSNDIQDGKATIRSFALSLRYSLCCYERVSAASHPKKHWFQYIALLIFCEKKVNLRLFFLLDRLNETVPIVLGLGDTENIYSPNYPFAYDSNTDLTWQAIAPAGYSIVITFITFEVEKEYDALIIYQGFTGNPAERIRSNALTGYQLPDPIKTFGSYVWLRFKSDVDTENGGFFVILSVEESIGLSKCSYFSIESIDLHVTCN